MESCSDDCVQLPLTCFLLRLFVVVLVCWSQERTVFAFSGSVSDGSAGDHARTPS